MKLLLDENLSDRIVAQILDLYPGSSHVKTYDLIRTDDAVIWSFARQHGSAIVSKDADYYGRSLVHGTPPKFIFCASATARPGHITRLFTFGVFRDLRV